MANYAILTLDIDSPVISGISPEVGSQDVGVDTPLVFTVTDTLAGINIATLSLSVVGEEAITGGVVQPGYTGQITQIPATREFLSRKTSQPYCPAVGGEVAVILKCWIKNVNLV